MKMKKRNSPHKDALPKNGNGFSIAAAALKAQLAVAISGLVLLLLFCAIASSSEDPDSMITPLSLCALFLSSFCGGFSSVRLSGDGLLSGIASGAVTSAVIFLLSLFPLADTGSNGGNTLLCYLCIIASAAAGAIIGKRRKNKSPHRHPPHRNGKRI